LVIAGRISFPFTLIDARHRPFVDGRRDTLLTLSQVVRSGNTVAFVTLWLFGAALLFLGGRSLVSDHSVTWKTADAVVTNITPAFGGNSNNYWYFYEFKTEAGEMVSDYIVEDGAKAHAIGDVVPVYYVKSDPNDNYYADDPLPRAVRDWIFVGLGAFMLGAGVYCIRSALSVYRALRRLAHSGKPIPGEIINVQPVYGRRHCRNQDKLPCQNGGRELYGRGCHDGCDGPWSSCGASPTGHESRHLVCRERGRRAALAGPPGGPRWREQAWSAMET
jgi:hypothetical protein